MWVRRGPGEHQTVMRRMTNSLERLAREDMSSEPEHCWVANLETNLFLGRSGKSDFVTPDFMVYRCLGGPYQDVRADDVLLVGEVLSPSKTPTEILAKAKRYGTAGIHWYWQIYLDRAASAIESVIAHYLVQMQDVPVPLPDGVHPLRRPFYLPVGEWTRATTPDGIKFTHPFPIHIPWSDLEF